MCTPFAFSSLLLILKKVKRRVVVDFGMGPGSWPQQYRPFMPRFGLRWAFVLSVVGHRPATGHHTDLAVYLGVVVKLSSGTH